MTPADAAAPPVAPVAPVGPPLGAAAAVHRVVTDPARLAALADTGLLDAPAEPAFDRLAALAARLLETPLATVTLVDADRQFYLACVGLPEPVASARETPLGMSFCRLAVADAVLGERPVSEALAIADTRLDARTRDMASVTEFGVHAYAGVPLVSGGQPVGALCVMDVRPRAWSPEQLEVLAELARAVAAEVELRAANRRLQRQAGELEAQVAAADRAAAALRASEERYALAARATSNAIWDWDLAAGTLAWNEAVHAIFGYRPGEVDDSITWWYDAIHPDDRERVVASVHQVIDDPAGGTAWHAEYRFRRGDGTYADVVDRGYVARAAAGDVAPAGGSPGRAYRMIGAMEDVTARRAAEAARERAAARTAQLRSLAAALAAAGTPREVADALLAHGTSALGVVCGTVGRLSHETRHAGVLAARAVGPATLTIVAAEGLPEHARLALERLVLDATTRQAIPFTEAAATGRAVYVRTPDELAARYPAVAAVASEMRVGAVAALPLVVEDGGEAPRVLGAVAFDYPAPREFAADERAQLEAVARQAAVALARADAAAEADLERRRLDAVLGALPVGVVVAEAPSGRLVYGNAAVARIWGANAATSRLEDYSADWVGYHVGADGGTTDRPYASHEWPLSRAIARGEVVADEAVDVVRPDGERRRVSLSAAPVRDGDGAVVGAVVATADVTEAARARDALAGALAVAERERARAREERERADAERARAVEANRAKSEFLATMSHELRTPLNAIAGYVQLLEMGLHGPVTDDQRVALGRVDRAQQHLLGLINDVLNFAKLESGRVEYDVRPTRVGAVLGDVLPLVEPQLAARELRLVVDVPEARGEAPVLVRADREKLGQVVLNLLSNAAKFTAPGGRVTVALDAPPGGGPARLRVADTGRGIPDDKLEAVFEPFVQVGKRYAGEAPGTGLGLAISRDLARGMGGDLTAESTPGVGSTFTVTLPRA